MLLPVTRWRIRNVPDWPNEVDVLLILDTVAPAIVAAVEQAAANADIDLRRLEEDDC